jgi:mono/diheme cytochrome c family protein
MSGRWIVAGVVVGALGLGSIAAQPRAIAQDRAQDGRRMFMEQGCHGCHTVGKVGTPIGPDPKLELTEPQIAALAAFLASLD